MRVHQLVAGVAVAALLPSFALAQRSCEQQSSNRAAGTVVGAGLGALLGGAVVGNQPSRSRADCGRAYGYYDGAGAWRASNVPRANAQGRFDREGRWVDGAPNGHCDRDGRRLLRQPGPPGPYIGLDSEGLRIWPSRPVGPGSRKRAGAD